MRVLAELSVIPLGCVALRHRAVQPLLDARRIGSRLISSVGRTLGFGIADLKTLCGRPLLFHREPTFATIEKLRRKLADSARLLERNACEACRYWRKQTEEEIRLAEPPAPASIAVGGSRRTV